MEKYNSSATLQCAENVLSINTHHAVPQKTPATQSLSDITVKQLVMINCILEKVTFICLCIIILQQKKADPPGGCTVSSDIT